MNILFTIIALVGIFVVSVTKAKAKELKESGKQQPKEEAPSEPWWETMSQQETKATTPKKKVASPQEAKSSITDILSGVKDASRDTHAKAETVIKKREGITLSLKNKTEAQKAVIYSEILNRKY